MHSAKERWLGLLLVAMLLLAATPLNVSATVPSRYFPETGHTVRGGFLQFFDANGGVTNFGYPITEEILDNGLMVQYFQRARFEWHPQNPGQYQIQLGLLGQEIHGSPDPAVAPLPAGPGASVRYFPETGHNVTNAFLQFWTTRGGLRIFGYPLTEAFTSAGVTYQWFQRARFEFRNGRVELGLIGTEWLAGRPAVPAAPPSPTLRSRYFPQTRQTVAGAFLDFFERKGGEALFGLPISGEFSENHVTVQYFRRARFEWRPQNPDPFKVQLGLIGQELYGPPAPPLADFRTPWNPNLTYFPQTGHTVSNAFLKFFQQNGGVEIFGYPLTEATAEEGAIIQWFQRARMVFKDNRVILANLGEQRFNPDAEGRFNPDQIFFFVWTNNARVQAIGKGLENAQSTTIVEQRFERGRVLLRSDSKAAFVLYDDGRWQAYTAPAATNPSPVYAAPPGRLTPDGAVGALWRSLGGPNSKLGWATSGATSAMSLAQRFQNGHMLYSVAERVIFVLYGDSHWEQFQDVYPGFGPEADP